MRALITGDFMHHPVQFAEPQLAEIGLVLVREDDALDAVPLGREHFLAHAADR